jgi:hypothetical protein
MNLPQDNLFIFTAACTFCFFAWDLLPTVMNSSWFYLPSSYPGITSDAWIAISGLILSYNVATVGTTSGTLITMSIICWLVSVSLFYNIIEYMSYVNYCASLSSPSRQCIHLLNCYNVTSVIVAIVNTIIGCMYCIAGFRYYRLMSSASKLNPAETLTVTVGNPVNHSK